MSAGVLGLSLVAAVLPFALSLFVAFRPEARSQLTVENYFLYGRRVTPERFLKTSVGYSLQVASIFLFMFWVFTYGLTALFVPVAWFGGYVLVGVALRFKLLDPFLGDQASKTVTIHNYLGRDARRPRFLVFALALATVVGLGGTMIVEIDYATSFILPLLGFQDVGGPYGERIAQIAVLIFTGAYVLWGGFKAVILTDEVQVPLSYGAFCIFLFSVCVLASAKGQGVHAGVVSLLAAALLVGFAVSRQVLIGQMLQQDRLLLISLAGLGAIVAWIAFTSTPATEIVSVLAVPSSDAFLGFGILGLLSLTLTNVVWQFVDISSLQRLQSVEFLPITSERRAKLTRGVLAAGIEAAGVWVLVILLAVALLAVGVESYDGLQSFLIARDGFASLLAPLLVFAYAVFMISTVDGFMSAISYVSYYDFHGVRSNAPTADFEEELKTPRWTTVVAVGFLYIGYLIRDSQVERIDQVLYAIYALQISILPAIFAKLVWPRSVYGPAGVSGVVVGFGFALYTALTAPMFGIHENSWYVLPPLAAILGASASYAVVAAIGHFADSRR